MTDMETKRTIKTDIDEREGPGVPQQKHEEKPQSLEMQSDDWLCFVCRNKITSEKERFLYNDSSEFEFNNPSGDHFHIITFSRAPGCVASGVPTSEYTWFTDHSWSFSLCSNCGLQLGWKYTGKYDFFGLIRTHLVLGLSMFN
jgi:hypothetical protein